MSGRMGEVATDLIRLIGRPATLRLITVATRQLNRGQRVRAILYVPGTPQPDHNFAKLIGWPAFVKLCEAYGGQIIEPCLPEVLYRAERNQVIRRLARQGVELAKIASAHGVTERTVRYVLAANDPLDAALDGDTRTRTG
ncbi:MAG: hypothetical protein KGZ52_02590 [Xanthomonadaceae bacterium]|nr:hypothetical protein [Xanthomonadaceae bacterium]